MARIRSVHPDICVDEVLAEVTASAERTFVRLWTHLDDAGRCVENPKLLKAALYPLHDDMTPDAVSADVDELVYHGLLLRYEVDGKHILAAKSAAWAERQKPKHPTPSKLPEMPEGYHPPRPPCPRPHPERGTPTPALPPDVPESLHGVVDGVGVGDGGGEELRAPERSGTALALVPTNGSSPTATVRPNRSEYPTDFEYWWHLYPRKTAKADAYKAWRKACKLTDATTLGTALLAACHGWAGRDPEHIPHAATWLNGRRWEDPPETQALPKRPKTHDVIAAVLAERNGQ